MIPNRVLSNRVKISDSKQALKSLVEQVIPNNIILLCFQIREFVFHNPAYIFISYAKLFIIYPLLGFELGNMTNNELQSVQYIDGLFAWRRMKRKGREDRAIL